MKKLEDAEFARVLADAGVDTKLVKETEKKDETEHIVDEKKHAENLKKKEKKKAKKVAAEVEETKVAEE
jgi:hypothetical protein